MSEMQPELCGKFRANERTQFNLDPALRQVSGVVGSLLGIIRSLILVRIPPTGHLGLKLRFVPTFRSPINLDVDAPPAKIQLAQVGCARQFDERYAGARTRPHHIQSSMPN